MLQKICLLAILALTSVQAGEFSPDLFEDCGSQGSVHMVIIPHCNAFPCVLIKGQSYDIEIHLTPHSGGDASDFRAIVTGIIAGIELPWPDGVNPDACNDLGTSPQKCPFPAGSTLHYKVNLEVNPSYPSVSVIAKWRIHSADGMNHICIKLPLRIQ